MILIDKLGFLHVNDPEANKNYEIEDKEALSFLRYCISGIHNNFTIRDFIKIFERYDSLLAIVPEFQEVIDLSKKYNNFNKIDIDSVCMQIGATISQDDAAMFFNLFGATKLQENLSLNIPANALNLKNLINSKLIILSEMDLSFDLDIENSFKGHLPFDIQQFTLFDFISIVSSNLVKVVENEMAGDEAFEEIKKKIFTIKNSLSENFDLNLDENKEVEEIDIKENTANIMKQMSEILNPKSGDDKKQ